MPEGGAQAELRARDVSVHFEGLIAVDGVDLTLRRDEILGLIGPNGAGKTTLVNILSGFQSPDGGEIWLEGQRTTGWPPHQLGRAGIARTFQGVRLFAGLSVLENVDVGGVGAGLSRARARERAWRIIDSLDLAGRAEELAGALPYGLERRVGIARALAMAPRFLLLDEPGAGLNETEADELMHVIAQIQAEFECGVLVIEHNMRLIMALCHRIQVLDQGRTIALGTPEEVERDRGVRRAYLGGHERTGDAAD